MKSLSLLTLALCTAGMIQATHGAAPDKFVLPDPVAIVEGKEIKAADVQKMLANLLQRSGKQLSDLTDEEKQQATRSVVDTLITQQIVTKQSVGIIVGDDEVDAYLKKFSSQFADPKQFDEQLKASGLTLEETKAQIRDTLRQRKWMDQQVDGKTEVTDAEAKDFFTGHPTYFDAPELVRASHILIRVPENATPEQVAEKEKAIAAAADRIAKGEDFAKVAQEVSEDPNSKDKGGDLDFFPKKGMIPFPEFTEAAFALQKDEVSKPVKTKAGFHLIKQTDRKDAHKMTYDEAKPRIFAFMKEDKKKSALRDLFRQLRAAATITNNLPAEPKSDTK